METFSHFSEAVARSSLQYHRTLNTKLWQDKKLDGAVRAKLLEISRAWQQFASIKNSDIIDVVLTGGNANFNYTRQSDLDVHLIIDYEKVTCDEVLVMDYFMSKKALWAANHTNIRVKGYPVELFAQDKKAEIPAGQGVYSLIKGRWIQEPTFLKLNFNKDALLAQKVEFYKKEIDNMVSGMQSIKVADNLKNKLRSMRGVAIQMGGEFSFENLVFKELRNRGYMDKLANYLKSNKEKQLSLP